MVLGCQGLKVLRLRIQCLGPSVCGHYHHGYRSRHCGGAVAATAAAAALRFRLSLLLQDMVCQLQGESLPAIKDMSFVCHGDRQRKRRPSFQQAQGPWDGDVNAHTVVVADAGRAKPPGPTKFHVAWRRKFQARALARASRYLC